jgi:large subunit ribosomal protein L4
MASKTNEGAAPGALKAKNLNGEDLVLDEVAFGAPFNNALVHESVRAELNARRQGTHSTKTRGNVRGGGAQPWRQKGTGRARAGSSRSPIWTGGGVTFGPQPRHYTFKVNRKEKRAALRSALSVHAERGSIATFDTKAFDTPSTQAAGKLLAEWGPKGSITVILSDEETQAALSFRNLAVVRAVLPADHVGVADLIGAANVLASAAAIDSLAARAKGAKSAGADSVEGLAGAKPPTTANKDGDS